jgi:hypothetical protein
MLLTRPDDRAKVGQINGRQEGEVSEALTTMVRGAAVTFVAKIESLAVQ